MMIMDRFTHDLETAELSEQECAEFGRIVGRLCDVQAQSRLSVYLALVCRPQMPAVCDYIAVHAGRMWRSEARL